MSGIYHGDCLEVMPRLPDDCADMILADLPYGTTPPMTQQDVAAADLEALVRDAYHEGMDDSTTGREWDGGEANELLSALQQRSGAVEREVMKVALTVLCGVQREAICLHQNTLKDVGMSIDGLRAILGGQSCP